MNVLLDLEFTGLDNTYIDDNDVTQIKLLCVETGKKLCQNCKTRRPVSVYDRLQGVTKYPGRRAFSAELFDWLLKKVRATREATFWGYSVEQDRKMLRKHDIDLQIGDLQEPIRLNPKYESQLAVGCASMEAVYFLLTGEVPCLESHYDEREMDLIQRIYEEVQKFDAEKQNRFLTLMPWGHCAGMPISEYVAGYRPAADGYRYNNEDLLARSLTHHVPVFGGHDVDDEDWGEDDEWDDEDEY